ncbi:MAG: bifunctional 4-hydroxy-2-oxoglutarate aldolase/2-dehydro-3-deoxy-phosphogluconate aldolase [Spirochaetes bacterium]|nr:MAG: bifunctional 4-hydroxy-2-oxoglutarate aldolase/2-dehydro-3-deoxy-phosphogluconate aldolase [Spirochaetota bacterium]
MARFRRLEVLTKIEEIGLIPVFFTPDEEKAKGILKACAKGGALCVEMTNRGDRAIEIFKTLEEYARTEFPDVILGVGSVVDAPTAALYIAYGANFVVGPVLDEETAILCNKRKIPYSPGCGSASEIHRAEALGVEICKIFPGAQVGGPGFVKAIRGPCPWTSIMPTGGVSPTRESLTEWFDAGVTAVGIGSKLVTKELLERGDFEALAEKIEDTIKLIKEIRKR